MHNYLCGFGGVLVSCGGATTSVGGVLDLVSSSVCYPLVIMNVLLFV